MKKIIIILINVLISSLSYGQTCGMSDPPLDPNVSSRSGCSTNTVLFKGNNLQTLIPDGANNQLTFKVNFVIAQRADGSGNLRLDNPEHVAFLDGMVNEMNTVLGNLTNQCNPCSSIQNFQDAAIRLDVNYIEVQDNFAWNHLNDSTGGECQTPACPTCSNCPGCNSFDKSYLMYINGLVSEPGFNCMITVDSINYEHFITNGLCGATPSEHYCGFWYSGFPSSSQLDHPGMCHFPDLFFNYHRNSSACVDPPWDAGALVDQIIYTGRTALHEIGHYWDLIHVSGNSSGCNANLMSSGTPCGTPCDWSSFHRTLTGCQLGTTFTSLMATNVRQYVECDTALDHAILVSTNQTWNNDLRIYGDVIVDENVELTISCNLFFQINGKIFVREGGKLIIDGAHLTTFCSDNKWAGIKIAGGNSDFDIEVKNGAIIENTSEAAITMWPTDSSDPGNGIARIENATFNNVRGVVGFFAKSSSINPSYVRNCIVNDARWGVSNTNCRNIEVSDNTFNDIELECIFGSMGSYHIFNNTFNSGEQDILFMNTSPALSSRIEFNTFNGRNTGYHADGSVFAQNLIRLNQFYNGQIDILNDGHNSFAAWYNMSHAGLGGVSFSNGDRPGEYAFNTFDGSFIAQLPVGDNPGFNFFENCYTSSFTDVYIDGSVAPIIQQGFGDAANNCFTHKGNNSVISDFGGNPAPFTYVEPKDHDVDCRDAINAHMNVLRDPIGTNLATPQCFDPFTTPPTVPFSPCHPQEGKEEAARQWLVNKIKEIENNSNLTDDQKEKLLSIYRNCLKKIIGRLAEILIEVGDYNGARALYQPESSDDDKVMVYGLYIVEGDIVSANNYLNGLSSESVQLTDFKTVQLSNLHRIQSGYTYEPSTSELAAIRTIAEKDHPYAAYAKALYYAYTGEVIVSSIPQFVQQELANRSNLLKANDKIVTINPNPFREQLNITLEGLDDPKIYVYDILGSTQSITFTEDYTTINTSNWSEGVYVVKVYDGSELIKTQKVVLVK